MTPQERDVIAGIFDRLKPAANQPRDPEAEQFIADRLREQPYAPYAMAQSVFVQEQALTNLQQRVEELETQLRQTQDRSQAQEKPQAQPQGGFLSGLFGSAGRNEPQQRSPGQMAAGGAWGGGQQAPRQGMMNAGPNQGMQPQGGGQQGGPWGGQQQMPQRQGGGFMASALTTAAGVAGGMVAGNLLMNAFSGGGSKPAADPAASAASSTDSPAATPASDQAAVSDQDSGAATQEAGYQDQGYQDAGYQDAGYDDGGGFDTGGDEWA